VFVSGTGVVTQNFCKLTLTHAGPVPKRPDRNISVEINTCTGVGKATIMLTSPSRAYTINDGNILVGVCSCGH